jgi:hypothetical protein
LSVLSEKVKLTIQDGKLNHNYSTDESLRNMITTMDIIEKKNYSHSMKRI